MRYNPSLGPLELRIKGCLAEAKKLAVEVRFYDRWQSLQVLYSPGHLKGKLETLAKGKFEIIESIPLPKNMTSGEYFLDIDITQPNIEFYMQMPKHVKLDVTGVTSITGLEFQKDNCGLLVLG